MHLYIIIHLVWKAFFSLFQMSQFPRRGTSVDWWRFFLVTPVRLFLQSLATITQRLLRKKRIIHSFYGYYSPFIALHSNGMWNEVKDVTSAVRGKNKQANILSSEAWGGGGLNIRLHFRIKSPINRNHKCVGFIKDNQSNHCCIIFCYPAILCY